MNSYEIEGKLRDKADKWELHGAQTEIRELKTHVSSLERKIDHIEILSSNRYYALDGLFNIIAEHPQFSDLTNQIYELKMKL